jgi:hypothetical protein
MPRNAERGEAVVVFQASELALHGCATTVKPLPFVGAVGDAVERDGATLAERHDGCALALSRLVHNPVAVVALVHGARLRFEAASAGSVELDVASGVPATLTHRDDVVELQTLARAAAPVMRLTLLPGLSDFAFASGRGEPSGQASTHWRED